MTKYWDISVDLAVQQCTPNTSAATDGLGGANVTKSTFGHYRAAMALAKPATEDKAVERLRGVGQRWARESGKTSMLSFTKAI